MSPTSLSCLLDAPTRNDFVVIDRMEEEVIRIRGVVELRTFAPVVAHRVCKDATIIVERGGWYRHACFGEGLQSLLGIL